MATGTANATAAVDVGAESHASSEGGHTKDIGYYALYFLFVSLVLGALARGATRHSRLPYTVALLFLGLLLGFLHSYVDLGALGKSLDIWVEIGPHTMLAVFLPALVFESAFSLEWHTFRRCATQVLWLAGPGVLMGTVLVGSLLKVTLPYDWGWGSSLMLGSILSATDPVAVVALLKEVGASKRLGHIIEGESLVNDGTAIVVFSLLNEIAKGATKTASEVVLFFLWVPTGSVLVGVGVAIGCHTWLGLGAVAGDHVVQISVTLFACYLCFLVAEFEAESSGVLAVVVLGVAIGAFGRGFFTGETEHSLHHFWEMLTFVANTVLFILTGVIIAKTTNESTLAGTLTASDLGYGFLVYFEVLFARAAVIAFLYPILKRRGYGLTLADATVCWWGGLRGAVGLALALVVNESTSEYSDEKVGPISLLCTGVVVVLTLAVNGTTTGALLRALGLTRPDVSVQVAVDKARRHIRRQCMAVYHEHLTTHDDVMGTADFRVVQELVPFLDEQDETRSDKFAGRLSVAAAKFTQINSKCAPCLTSCSDCVRGWCAWCFPGTAHGVGVGATGGTSGGGTGAGLKPPEKHDGMRRHETGSSAGSDLNILDSVDLSLDDARAGLGGIPNGISELPFTSLPLSRHRRQTSQEISLGSGGFLTPNSSMVNLAAFAEAAEKHASIVENINDLGAIQENDSSDTATSVGPSAASASLAGAPVRHLSGAPALLPSQSTKNALGEVGGAPADLGLAVSIAVRRDFDELVRVWSRDVRGRFLAHTKVLYWESLEEGRATKEVVETLVECADIALDTLDEPLCDWEALKHRVLGKAQKGSSLWKRLYRSLPGPLRETVKWTRQWVLHSGAVGAGGSRRRALVAAALFHDARREANHAIFGHLDENETHCEEKFGGKEIAREIKEIKQKKAADKVDINDVSLLYDSDDEKEAGAQRDPARVAAQRVRLEAERCADAAKSYLRAARTNEPELAAAVKSEETARRLLATAERSARGYVQSGLLTEAEAAELLAGVARAQRRLRLDPPEPVTRDPRDLMRMSPLLDPTHPARVRDPFLVERLTRDAPSMLVKRFPGDVVDPNSLAPNGGLLVLARGVVDVEWSKPIGEGGGGGSAAPLRVGASSTSYGWAIGAADLLTPNAARFKMRAVSTVTAFVLPPDLVTAMMNANGGGSMSAGGAERRRGSMDGQMKGVSFPDGDASFGKNETQTQLQTLPSNGTSDALWRCAFGLLAATCLREDLASARVPARAVRTAVSKSKISVKRVGATVIGSPFPSRQDPKNNPPTELVVLLAGEVYDDSTGVLVGPCVLVPATDNSLAFAEQNPDRFAAFGKLAARMGMSSDGAVVVTPEKGLVGTRSNDMSGVLQRHGSGSLGANGGGEHPPPGGSPMIVNEVATILRVPLFRPNESSAVFGSGGFGGGESRLEHGVGSGSFRGGVTSGISSPPKTTSYLPGLEGSGWGKFGANPLELSRVTDHKERRRISVNVGSLNLANQRAKECGGDENAAQREFSRFLSEARDGNKASRHGAGPAGSLTRPMAGDCCPYIVQYIAIGHDVNHFSQRNLRNGDPNFGSTEDFSRHSSGGDLISLGEGVSYDGPLGALRDSEGRDNYASSLDRTTARILSRNLKRDIFAPRRGSLDARGKAIAQEAASMAGSFLADRAFGPGASATQSARRANVTSPRPSMGGLFRRQSANKDDSPPTVGGESADTYPPRPTGGSRKTQTRRGSIGAALFAKSNASSTATNNSSEDTFPPRRRGGGDARPSKVVEWTHEASSDDDDEEATINF